MSPFEPAARQSEALGFAIRGMLGLDDRAELIDRQGRVHARVSVDLPREFGRDLARASARLRHHLSAFLPIP